MVPGILGLWAVGSVASSWLLESRLRATNSPHPGRPVPTAQDSGSEALGSVARTRLNTDSHICCLNSRHPSCEALGSNTLGLRRGLSTECQPCEPELEPQSHTIKENNQSRV